MLSVRNLRKKRFIYAALLLGLLITIGSLGPFDIRTILRMHSTADFGINGLFHLTLHRLVHFAAFGLLSILVSIAMENFLQRLRCLAIVAAFAILIEQAESLLSHNMFETWDVRDDVWAAMAGLLTVEVALRSMKQRAGHPGQVEDTSKISCEEAFPKETV